MELSAAFAAQLRALPEGEPTGSALVAVFTDLAAACQRAVPSFLGLSVVVLSAEMPVVFTSVNEQDDPQRTITSATIPLHALDPGCWPGSEITFFASTPGALVDLAADFDHALGLGAGLVRLDEVRQLPVEDPAAQDQLRARHQAVGVLIDRGHDGASALVELRRLAEQGRISPHAAALRVLDSADRPAGESGI